MKKRCKFWGIVGNLTCLLIVCGVAVLLAYALGSIIIMGQSLEHISKDMCQIRGWEAGKAEQLANVEKRLAHIGNALTAMTVMWAETGTHSITGVTFTSVQFTDRNSAVLDVKALNKEDKQ